MNDVNKQEPLRIASIVGARPQFVKLAPVCRAIDAHNAAGGAPIKHYIVHTGQHYDPELSDIFFDELEIPRPDVNLGVGSGPHGQQSDVQRGPRLRRLQAHPEDPLDEPQPRVEGGPGQVRPRRGRGLVAAFGQVGAEHLGQPGAVRQVVGDQRAEFPVDERGQPLAPGPQRIKEEPA